MKKRLFAVHLLNDRSGSPLVLRQAMEALADDYNIEIYTATPSGDGFLNDIEGVALHENFYRHSENKFITLAYFLASQFKLFCNLFKKLNRNDTVYINTLLPFGAALAAKLKGSRIIYHIHETCIRPAVLKRFLVAIASFTAQRVIFVSRYVADHYHFKTKATVIYNSLPLQFIQDTDAIPKLNIRKPFTVTMLCSLKDYKGIYTFVSIAKQQSDMAFELVLNASPQQVALFKQQTSPPVNCKIFAAQSNTRAFYEKAHVVMNLSDSSKWIETFGLTLLEAMQCGRPVICPVVGGVLELVKDGQEGFTIDSKDEHLIGEKLQLLATDFNLYKRLSAAAFHRAQQFTAPVFQQTLNTVFSQEDLSASGKTNPDFFRKTEAGQA